MPRIRTFAMSLAASIALGSALGSGAAAAAVALDEQELSQVHAAGLPEPALRQVALGTAGDAGFAQQVLHEQIAALDRQQSLAQYKFAALTAQGGLGVMQALALAGLATPVAPLFIPVLAMPLPFFMPLPPQNPPPKH
jgi:hypothetical protein